jgi:hypothetical protein
MTATRRRPVFDPADVALFYASVREAALQDRLRNLCRTLGLRHVHTHDSRRTEPGEPDSRIVRDPLEWDRPWVLWIELKSERGRLSPAQREWAAALRDAEEASGGAMCYRLVRPSTWDRFVELLTSGKKGG